MSTIKQKADAEAAQAEAEFPDDPAAEPGAEPAEQPADEPGDDEDPETREPEPEPEPAGRRGKSPQEKFQAAFAAFVKKAADCFEITPAEVQVAPHPGVVGIILPGFSEPRTHDNYKRCETCNGLGKVLTGAMTGDEAKDWHACPDTRCKGRGFWEKASAQPQAPATGPLAVGAPPPSNGEYGEAPAWMGDPNLSPQV